MCSYNIDPPYLDDATVPISFCLPSGPSSVFILSPRPSLAPLNSITIFTCRAASHLVQELLWEVDGGQTSSSAYAAVLRERGIHWSSTEDPERGWTTLQLRAHATASNNGTEIQCVAFPTSSSKVRKTALTTLTVYGMLYWTCTVPCVSIC